MCRTWRVTLLLLIAFALTASAGNAASREITVAVGVDATSLDPPISTNITDKNVTSAIYDTLLYRNAEMKLEPWLATAWRLVDDLTWEFKLRGGVRFHNGEPFTAEAVKFSLERILDPTLGARSFAQYTALSRVDVVDDSTVRVITKQPYPILPVVMAETWIVPPKYAVVRHGEPADAMFFVMSGQVEVDVPPHPVRLGPGQFFGEIGLLHDTVRMATVTTITECQLLSLAVADFRRLLEANPSLKAAIAQVAEQRTAAAQANQDGPSAPGPSAGRS